MRVCVVYPKTGLDKKDFSIGIPLSALHIASAVKTAGYDVVLVDRRLGQEVPLCFDFYLFSCMTGYQIKDALEIASLIRINNKTACFVWGGVHPSLLPEQTMSDPLVDCVIVGEGERVILDVLKQNRPGDVFVEKEFLQLDDLPPPDYSLIDVNNYFLNLYQSRKTLSLLTGKGCPFGCKFCYNASFNKRKWRGLSAEKIIERIKQLKSFGAESIDLVDDNFFVSIDRVSKFCELVKKEDLNLSFMTNCRADMIASFPDEFLTKLKNVGFGELFVGIESGNERVLDYIGKDLTLKQIYECNAKLKKAGIRPIYSFMCGFPTETREEVFDTLNVMMKLLQENPDASVTSLKIFTPFPGTALFDECVTFGFVPPERFEDWGDFDYNTVKYKNNKLLEKLSLLTYFLDTKTLSGVTKNPLLKMAISIYCKIVWLRCKHKFFCFTPETRLIKWAKKGR